MKIVAKNLSDGATAIAVLLRYIVAKNFGYDIFPLFATTCVEAKSILQIQCPFTSFSLQNYERSIRVFDSSNISNIGKYLIQPSIVYAFGVVLLELIAGRKPIETKRGAREENLVCGYAKELTGLDLKNCRHCNPFLEEVTVLYIPDLSDCLPSIDAWRDQWLSNKKAIAGRECLQALKGEYLSGMCKDVSINKFFDEAMVVELAQQAADLHQQMI
ncbi:cell division cycle and apoptosis regulator protein 1-like protein isoform X1 [Tanacetum coccineum]|uniref:Cell division cycle and apoptosis regulator protein 1-like protein isoform X1 n=1 Tax=Tanacetum coccineum TaxID=301880 RepID=A0ABQ5AGB2_9ASTR